MQLTGIEDMGLEGVELVMAYEDAFGIAIPDAEAERLRTPGDVVRFFSARLNPGPGAACLHLSAFHVTRRGLGERFGLPRSAVTLDMQVEDLLPDRNRREAWRSLGASLGVRLVAGRSAWPELVRPRWILGSVLVAGIAAFVAAWRYLPVPPGAIRLWLAILTTSMALFALARLTRPLGVRVPERLATVGGLTEFLARTLPYTTITHGRGWSAEQIEQVVRRVTIEVLGVTSFDLEDEFVRDLGVN